MAWTTESELDSGTSTGNIGDWPSYYYEDIVRILSNPNCRGLALRNVIFRGEHLTVLNGTDSTGTFLNVIAIGCPPYYPKLKPEAIPGAFLAGS